jgi:hypothetical protein
VFTFAKLVKLSDNVSEILTVVVPEHNSELSLHLLEEDQSSKERRNYMKAAFAQQLFKKSGFLRLSLFFLRFLG